MCKISDYPGLYSKAEGLLRNEKISNEIPGYEFLKRAIVVYKVEGKIPEKQLLEDVKKGMLVPANDNKEQKEGRDEVEQWMIEAIRSVGIKLSLYQFIPKLAHEL